MSTSNQLAESLSPYLLQHADNPVHWYPWGEEALALARRLDRPVLLSIGYSACHWCHVMAHESFESPAIAETMNRDFINIKVDREERPDLDRIYQLTHQLLTGRGGGWPLTVFLDPEDLGPFFAGTYFPPEPRHGMIAFPDLLGRIDRFWKTRRGDLNRQNEQLHRALASLDEADPQAELPSVHLADECVSQLQNFFDPDHGGFGAGPKFPQSPVLELLASMTLRGNQAARYLLYGTLTAMARSGLVDHLAGGFYRYCVDREWEIPHFEKMLFDNAQLLPLYAEMAVTWKEPALATTARRTAGWLLEEMRLPEGPMAASLDADTPEGEGASYLWTPDQVRAALEPGDSRRIIRRFGLDGPPNFESAQWHLVVRSSLAETASQGETDTEAARALEEAGRRLLTVRRQRISPARDDKVVGSWNGLAAAGLIRAGRALDEPDWCQHGETIIRFLETELYDGARPRAIWRNGRSDHPVTLDDYGAFLSACLESLQWRFSFERLSLAESLVEIILERYQDPVTGVLYLTPHDHEALLTRPRAQMDEAVPAGGGLALLGTLRLGHLAARPAYIQAAEKALAVTGPDIRRQPTTHATLIQALVELHQPATQVLIGGPDEPASRWHQSLLARPRLLCYRIPDDLDETLPGPLASLAAATRPTAVVCRGTSCLPPIYDQDELRKQLDEQRDEAINPAR